MSAPTTTAEFLDLAKKSGVVDLESVSAHLQQLRAAGTLPADAKGFADSLVARGLLTHFQSEQLLKGRWRGFTLGRYQILERIGSGGMGVVYLAEHKHLQRRVAIKVLPAHLAKDSWFVQQFYREAQAIAALDHPNIVHAHDIAQEGDLHFLVMEYVDGSSLQEIVLKHGPMAIERVPHYLRQAALGLQCAHEAGLVHRDIKPGNLLLDRRGSIKILDMGLAHFFARRPADVFTSNDRAKRMVGTDDFLAPEQIVDSDDVDIRADIYGLGGTAYFLLTGKPPFHDTEHDNHKLIWHLTRRPKSITTLRPEVPAELVAIVERMMAKNPWERPQTPAEVAEVFTPWTRNPIALPAESEMPGLSLAAQRIVTPGSSAARRAQGRNSWVICNTPPPSSANSGLRRESSEGDAQKSS
jgi:serine/threonine protein kinase